MKPFKLSRSKIELYIECPCCFYLDRKLSIPRPAGLPFTLNNAVDDLLKKEFDFYREKRSPHPLMKQYGIDAIPYQHEKLAEWRFNRKGIAHYHDATEFHVYGAVDEVWVNSSGELIVVDFKATSKKDGVGIDADWQMTYKRQMEIYQWLFRRNGFRVAEEGYFVYCNGKKELPSFDGKLEFDVFLFPYKGDDSWIDAKLVEIKSCLSSSQLPEPHLDCDICQYRNQISDVLR